MKQKNNTSLLWISFVRASDWADATDSALALRISEENAGIILSNLADNALRHGSTTLEISAARRDNRMLVRIADDGEGVSVNNRPQIFDSFFTTRRDSGGTGMGLAIVRAMLDAHGGTIHLVETARGTAFELNVPLADAPASS